MLMLALHLLSRFGSIPIRLSQQHHRILRALRCERCQLVRVAVTAAAVLGQGRRRLRDPTDQHAVLLRLRVPGQLGPAGHHAAHRQVMSSANVLKFATYVY